jgi:hypothetical protein
MGQVAWVVVSGYPHHITERGNRRQQTFFGEGLTRNKPGPKKKSEGN